jgi:hypothetical protein
VQGKRGRKDGSKGDIEKGRRDKEREKKGSV